MRKEEYSLLSDFLYEAIYIPDGTACLLYTSRAAWRFYIYWCLSWRNTNPIDKWNFCAAQYLSLIHISTPLQTASADIACITEGGGKAKLLALRTNVSAPMKSGRHKNEKKGVPKWKSKSTEKSGITQKRCFSDCHCGSSFFLPVPAWWRWVSISCSSPMSARKPYRGCAFWEPHPLRLLVLLNITEWPQSCLLYTSRCV